MVEGNETSGPYAYLHYQWVSYDDAKSIQKKVSASNALSDNKARILKLSLKQNKCSLFLGFLNFSDRVHYENGVGWWNGVGYGFG